MLYPMSTSYTTAMSGVCAFFSIGISAVPDVVIIVCTKGVTFGTIAPES
jgi:hypothetical protein